MDILPSMPAPVATSTYTVDRRTAQELEQVSRAWDVSRSEAFRRAVQRAYAELPRSPTKTALDAFDELQASLELSPEAARAWERSVRAGRRAAGSRLGRATR